MPEYLAPGVYMEEVEIGAKPVEGVGTSTAGFIGYAERGPLDKPVLVTGFGEFRTVFGGFLPDREGGVGSGVDISRIRWLAYAVSAFFENGGKRVYVTRVASRGAADSAVSASGFIPGESGPKAVQLFASSPGTWGNGLQVTVKGASLCSTVLTAAVSDSKRLELETVTGIEPGSLLRVTVSGKTAYLKVKEVHKTPTVRAVTVNAKVTLERGDAVETVEYDFYVTDGKNEEVFKGLSLNAKHSRYVKNVITGNSSNLIVIGDINKSSFPLVPTPIDATGYGCSGGRDGFPADMISDTAINTVYLGSDSDEPAERTGLYTFKNIDEINIVAIPGITTDFLQQRLITHCEVDMKDRFAVLDSRAGAGLDDVKRQRGLHDSGYAALYYPWVHAFDPLSKRYVNMPPSGYVCGVYARTDVERGVHKAPANEKINGVVNTERFGEKFRIINKGTQEILNPLGINCIRAFPGRGIRVWGGRTLSSDLSWKYINVRRLFLFLEESIEKSTQWVVFEPNNQGLWARVKQTVTHFLTSVWKDGALMGSTPEEAFFVKCDRTTMTQNDIDNGRFVILIGVSPAKPAEFVIFRIAHTAAKGQ